jgi:hypothetical protein
VFGMGTGVTLAVYSPAHLGVLRRLFPPRVCSNNLNPSCNRACRTCCEPDLVREYKLSKNGGRPLIPQQCVARPLRSRGFVVHNLSRPTQHSHEGELHEHIPDSCSDDIVSHRDG